MRLRPMWPMYGTYIATLLGLALCMRASLSNTFVVKKKEEKVFSFLFLLPFLYFMLKASD
jgi:hypothetical protein